jgi:cytochrome c551/c552
MNLVGMNLRMSTIFFTSFMWLFAAACSSAQRQADPPTIQARVAHGKYLVRSYGCETCHEILNIDGVRGSIGPSLKHIATKYYLAGQLPNSPENLRRWIQYPHSINPQTLMPDMNVTDDDAVDIALFLDTLQ